jgi:hypothetical protein
MNLDMNPTQSIEKNVYTVLSSSFGGKYLLFFFKRKLGLTNECCMEGIELGISPCY